MTHKDLEVCEKSMELVTIIYQLSGKFPKEEIYGLTSQIRRSAISIPSNLAEGAARAHRNEFIQFIYISMGSLSELETQIIISGNLGYYNPDGVKELISRIITIRIMLSGLIKALKQKS